MDENNRNPYDQGVGGQQSNPYGSAPTNGAPQGTPFSQADPYGTQQNPYGGQAQQANPYGGQAQQANPYGGQPQQTNPYGAQQNPYGGQPQQANPYGAQPRQGMSPYPQAGANPYATPYTGGAAPAAPKPPKKKMSGKMKALIFGGIGAVVLAVGLYFLFTLVIFPPRKTLDAAYENSFKAEDMLKTPLTKELGMGDLSKSIRESGGYFSAEFDFGSLSQDKTGKSSVKTEGVINRGAKQLSGDVSLVHDGETIAEADVYADEEQTYFTVQDLMNGYLAFNNKNIISALKSSKLFEGHEEVIEALASVPDISIDYFGDGPLISGLGDIAGSGNIFSELWEQSKVSRAGSENIYIGSDTISTKKFEVTIPKETLQDLAGKLMDQAAETLNSDKYSKYLQQAGVTADQLKQMIQQYRGVIKNMITEDITYYAYVYDEKVVSLKAEGSLKLSGVAINYSFDLITYSDDEKSQLSLKATLGVMGQSVEMSGSISSKKTGEGYVTNVEAGLTAAGRNFMGLSYSHTYEPSSRKITGNGSLQMEGSTVATMNLEGEVTELTQGRSITVDLSKIEVRSDKAEITSSAKVTFSTLDASGKSVTPLDSSRKVVNVMNATEEEIKSVVDKNSEGYKKFAERVAKWAQDLH